MDESTVIKKTNRNHIYNLRCEICIGTEPTTDKKLKVILQKVRVLSYVS